ncbi:MAG: glycosyl transferase family 2, partial [Sporomusa sp.]|nr:glycosyl transferase family 2 [Sporomusa sp.]
LTKWEEGFDVVQTVRVDTSGVSWLKKFTSSMFYRLINIMSDVHIVEGGSDFRLLDRKVVQTFRSFKEKARFIRGIIGDMGYRQAQVEFVAPERFAGKSKFSPRKMLSFALAGITAYSKLPLRVAFYLGLLFGVLSFGLTLNVVYTKLFTADAVPGWATVAVSILTLGGIQLVGLGIIGEYVGRIFEEVKQRPLYWVSAEFKSGTEKIKLQQ